MFFYDQRYYLCASNMKRLLVWLLIAQFATGLHALQELAGLPFLIQHFSEHREQAPAISFAEFIRLHYFDSSHRESDPGHEQLPLHCHAHAVTTETAVCPAPTPLLACAPSAPSRRPALHPRDNALLPADYTGSLLRPPIS